MELSEKQLAAIVAQAVAQSWTKKEAPKKPKKKPICNTKNCTLVEAEKLIEGQMVYPQQQNKETSKLFKKGDFLEAYFYYTSEEELHFKGTSDRVKIRKGKKFWVKDNVVGPIHKKEEEEAKERKEKWEKIREETCQILNDEAPKYQFKPVEHTSYAILIENQNFNNIRLEVTNSGTLEVYQRIQVRGRPERIKLPWEPESNQEMFQNILELLKMYIESFKEEQEK